MHPIRTLLAGFLALFLAGFTLVGTAGSASAADDPARFWMYYSVVDDEFVAYLDKGVGATNPADGSVEAFRYGTSTEFPPHIAPRADVAEVSFEEVCGHVDAKDGQKRVAVVIDFGVEQDAAGGQEPPAPYAACAQVARKATGLQVLDAVAEVRSENSDFGPSLCAIDGYPASGPCFGSGPEASPDDGEPVAFAIEGVDKESDDEDDDSNVPLLVGAGAVVVLLGAGGVLLARRNKA